MRILSTEPSPISQRQDREADREQVAGPAARLAVRDSLDEAFAYMVDDVRLAEVDGTLHIYVSVNPAASAGPEHIRAAAREAYREAVSGGPDVVAPVVVAHVAVAGKGRAHS
ncbi:hypothetical protein [Sphaerimonospora thailandensis]|uniref:Uncharacterized protein n=1 Tax=Sphaerimonospora thailandensis TaxID=795644 RepID=A0A8J3RD61_9ACTN|nr:hypothetical protein [Sphaerimonospora thailandensis]GIH72595.1 hypothetical protein Mth01_48480 [Sphaerimonospora thailandensis]